MGPVCDVVKLKQKNLGLQKFSVCDVCENSRDMIGQRVCIDKAVFFLDYGFSLDAQKKEEEKSQALDD